MAERSKFSHEPGNGGGGGVLRSALVWLALVPLTAMRQRRRHRAEALSAGSGGAAEPIGNPETSYEQSDISLRAVAILAIGTFLWLALMPLILSWGYSQSTSDVAKSPTIVPPAPRLQVDPQQALRDHRAEKERELTTYGWVDRDKQVVHIPIAEAMKRIAERGIDDWPAAGGARK
jgi:hypothetical protein